MKDKGYYFMTLREFNEILNKELSLFYQAKDMYMQEQKDNNFDFRYNLNVPFIQQKKYSVGNYLFFIGTNHNIKQHIGQIRHESFLNFFSIEQMVPYMDEEVEPAIIKIVIDDLKKSILGIQNSDEKTRERFQYELTWHQSEIDK